MPLQSGDMRIARSAVMADVANGGGPPSSQLLADGSSNGVVPDISEDARTGGLVEIRQLHVVLRNPDTASLLGANVILAEPPADPAVSITLIKSPGTFARRPDLVKQIEATSTPGSEFGGFLLENHIAQQRSITIAQRPGVEAPATNTTLYLVFDEGLVSERAEYVRVRRVTVTTEVFTTTDAQGNPEDFFVQVATCELFSPLKNDYPGTAANRLYARSANKTKTRRVTFSDAGTFYSASRLVEAAGPTDMSVKLDTVYTQLVPNTRTETPLLNQRSGGQRTITLIDSVGALEVSAAGHTARIFVTEANQGNSFVAKLNPPPAPGSVSVSYMALGSWATIIDDGAGALGDGPGSGTVLYQTGDVSITTEALPDYNTFILISWASTAPYVNNCASGQVSLAQAIQFELDTTRGANYTGATITWTSGGAAKTATVNAAGLISGDATGFANGALGKVWISPSAMPDTSASFAITCQSLPTVTESISSPNLDAAGYAALTFAQEATPGTVRVRWITARKVSKTSGADLSGSALKDGSKTRYTKTSESATNNTMVVVHQIADDGAGGWGDPTLGNVNYAGQTASLRVTSQGAVVESYRQDHEKATAFTNVIVEMSA